ncbi:MAG: hypothetical protein IJT59_05565 [Desulfovibrionaceae bacterium]|nr:hypothetical protein [Desulfovibrionaceae bacterium]
MTVRPWLTARNLPLMWSLDCKVNESLDSNRFTPVTPKSENDVRLQATLGNQNPTGLPVGAVSFKD